MNNKPTLSISSYYGGKSRMAHFIADRLDYDNTDIFVTNFGGMCRVLLNKPRHKVECYNDYNSGLCALMTVLSDPIKASKFIHRLYEETEYSEEEFLKQKAIYDSFEIDSEMQEREKLRQLLLKNEIVIPTLSNRFLNLILAETLPDFAPEIKITKALKECKNNLEKKVIADEMFRESFQKQLTNWLELYQYKCENGILPRPFDMDKNLYDLSEMDMAVATYVTFKMSRDGMGQVFSNVKFKSNQHYHDAVLGLYDCAERLEGVQVFQIDAMAFFKDLKNANDPAYKLFGDWLDDPHVMFCCDPSYISPESERKLLEGIDVNIEPNLSDAIQKKYNGKMPKNLGKIYSCSFGYEEQEAFVRAIQNAKCRIIVCNYDLQLYNKYLNPSTGWRREEFVTFTAVGGKADNTRVEVVWYNY